MGFSLGDAALAFAGGAAEAYSKDAEDKKKRERDAIQRAQALRDQAAMEKKAATFRLNMEDYYKKKQLAEKVSLAGGANSVTGQAYIARNVLGIQDNAQVKSFVKGYNGTPAKGTEYLYEPMESPMAAGYKNIYTEEQLAEMPKSIRKIYEEEYAQIQEQNKDLIDGWAVSDVRTEAFSDEELSILDQERVASDSYSDDYNRYILDQFGNVMNSIPLRVRPKPIPKSEFTKTLENVEKLQSLRSLADAEEASGNTSRATQLRDAADIVANKLNLVKDTTASNDVESLMDNLQSVATLEAQATAARESGNIEEAERLESNLAIVRREANLEETLTPSEVAIQLQQEESSLLDAAYDETASEEEKAKAQRNLEIFRKQNSLGLEGKLTNAPGFFTNNEGRVVRLLMDGNGGYYYGKDKVDISEFTPVTEDSATAVEETKINITKGFTDLRRSVQDTRAMEEALDDFVNTYRPEQAGIPGALMKFIDAAGANIRGVTDAMNLTESMTIAEKKQRLQDAGVDLEKLFAENPAFGAGYSESARIDITYKFAAVMKSSGKTQLSNEDLKRAASTLSGSGDKLLGQIQYAKDSAKRRRISSLREIVTLPSNISKADKRPYAIALLEDSGFVKNSQDPNVPSYTIDPSTGSVYIRGLNGKPVDYIDELMKKNTPGNY